MPVHSISSDLHAGNVNRYAISLSRTMSKLLALGMPLADVVRAVTATPARMLHLDERGFGTLAVGAPAHVTIFDVRDEAREIEDAEGEKRTAKQWIVPRARVRRRYAASSAARNCDDDREHLSDVSGSTA